MTSAEPTANETANETANDGKITTDNTGTGTETNATTREITGSRGRRGKSLSTNRASLVHKARYAMRNPGRITPYLKRATRDAWLRTKHRDHIAYYRAVMAHDTHHNPEAAVGSKTHDRWLALGRMQFDYLIEHGLRPHHHMLDIGCGNLRAGHHFITYLDPGHYYGIDISPDILIAAKATLTTYRLQHKLPHLTITGDLTFDFLPDHHFDVVHAHSVFSHSPLTVIDQALAHVGRILAPTGHFDFTYDRTEGTEHHVLREDFYYRTETLIGLAHHHGLAAHFMNDWETRPHGQSKIRVTHPTPENNNEGGEETTKETQRESGRS